MQVKQSLYLHNTSVYVYICINKQYKHNKTDFNMSPLASKKTEIVRELSQAEFDYLLSQAKGDNNEEVIIHNNEDVVRQCGFVVKKTILGRTYMLDAYMEFDLEKETVDYIVSDFYYEIKGEIKHLNINKVQTEKVKSKLLSIEAELLEYNKQQKEEDYQAESELKEFNNDPYGYLGLTPQMFS